MGFVLGGVIVLTLAGLVVYPVLPAWLKSAKKPKDIS